MKPRMFLVVIILMFAALACNMPVVQTGAAGTGTPTGSLDILTLAAQTAQAGQTPQATITQLSTVSASITPFPTWTPAATSLPATATIQPCDAAGFIQDVTVPDGTKMTPGQAFTKTWRLRNNGTCTWNTSYALVFSGGESMGAPAVINLPGSVPPDATVDLSVNMKAPAAPGKYEGDWKLRNSTGLVFGVVGSQPIFVQIQVIPATPTVTATPTNTKTPTATATVNTTTGLIYDFTVNMCKAEWRSQAGVLDCPGVNGDAKGYVMRLQNPTMETGAVENNPVLLTYPEANNPWAITGKYPTINLQSGYHFQAIIGCLNGATACNVKYQVNYSTDGGSHWSNLGEWSHTYSGTVQGIDIDLTSLANQNVQIALVVLANNSSAVQQQAVWVFPRIVKQ